MKEDRLYLLHIRDAIARIERYTASGQEIFLADTLIQDAVLRNLQTLAESSMRLSDELKVNHTATDWRAIAGFRNVVVHDYLDIRLERVWSIVQQDLPALKQAIENMLAKLEGQP